ncbi:MAG: patatin family protein [Ruminococcaceae bacterium]|nr:patatin family protein [Oscillospiraceae bacterium]
MSIKCSEYFLLQSSTCSGIITASALKLGQRKDDIVVGIIDVGGGLRGIYTSGIYDYLLDNFIDIDYCLGVSAGSANLITYIAGQKGRLKRFYEEYSFEKQYMSLGNYLKKGMLIDLDYIYSGITNTTGKDPLDFDAIKNSDKRFVAVTTEVSSGKSRYFTKEDISLNEYTLLKAGCALPVVCRKPIFFRGENHFDGGLSDPIPYKKAFADGCDKLIICLTLPIDHRKSPMPKTLSKLLLKKYPEISNLIISSDSTYNSLINEIIRLEKDGSVLILAPENCFGIKTVTRDKEGLRKLYNLGYKDGEKIKAFLKIK